MPRRLPPELDAAEVRAAMEHAWERGLRPRMTLAHVKDWARRHGYQIAGAVRLWHLMRELSGDYELDKEKVRRQILRNENLIRSLWNR